ncbi:hypothetical protein Zmor_007397 [Zophobas morio]|uniref:Uncharacterized protein n=1 Tax=Zophobas morio TaxID=2755281 RepID=A0AA38IRY2_9CUCU|nr:hypothetical protein Zmor_007397 [Zophobas morio]
MLNTCNVTFDIDAAAQLCGSDERRGERKKKKKERRALGEDDEGRCRGFGKRDRVRKTREGLRREHQRPTESRRGTGSEADLNRTAATGTGVLRIGTNTVSRREVRADRPGETGSVPVCVVPVVLPPIVTGRRFTRVINSPTSELLPPPPIYINFLYIQALLYT